MVKVFIVDDDMYLPKVLGSILSIGGHFVVDIAENGKEAIEKFICLDPKPEIILMDYRMPIMNGVDATRALLQIDPSVRVIFISGDGSVKDEAMEAGAIDFLVKPIGSTKLFESIEKYAVV